VIFFSILQLVASGYALARGGAPERVVGLSLLLAFGVSVLLQQPMAERFVTVEWGMLAVDIVLLAVLVTVALHADRFWPLWVAAFHALSTGAHMIRGLDHGIEPFAYAILLASWSYPIVLLLAIGTLRHAERRKRHGHDLDWSFPLIRRADAG
jgi:hypothetical protein